MSEQTIGAFRILSELGKGAQGRVFHAVAEGHASLPNGKEVALKVLPVHPAAGSPEKLLASYSEFVGRDFHPNVTKYYDAFLSEDVGRPQLCLVMEYVQGESFDHFVKKHPKGISWDEAKEWILSSLDALSALSKAGIVHRDVKPGNLFLLKDGTVKWIDLDLAPGGDAPGPDDEERTVAWQGSLEYMAPEFVQVPGFTGDEQSDLFSFAVCAYEILIGQRPFGDLGERPDLAYAQRWQKGNDTTPNLRTGPFRVMEGLTAAFTKALQQDRERRFPDFASFHAALAEVRPRILSFPIEKEEFELQSLLGRGGFGEVYKAVRKRDGKVVAVKNLFSSQYSRRFIKEANILKDYAHPHIVGYEGLFSQETKGEGLEYFLVMEFLDGEPLNRRLKDAAPNGLPAEEGIQLFVGYLDALHHLHSAPQPIIHRDIKPGNLYAPVGAPQKAKLLDMGVARDVSGTETFGHIPGTLAYMPPEFARPDGGRGTPQSDIYAMGFCLYETLVGESVAPRLPRDMDQAYIAFFKRSQRPLIINFDKPVFRSHPGLMRVIARSLAFEPDSRYRTAEEMKQDLERILSPEQGANAGDYDLTLSEVIGPKLVIDQAYADKHMANWDESKFVPPKLPSEVMGSESSNMWGWIAGLAAAVAVVAAGGLIYMKLNPPESGLSPAWIQTIQDQYTAGAEAAKVDDVRAVLAEVERLRAEPEAEKSGDMLDRIQGAARERTRHMLAAAFAGVEEAGAGDDTTILEEKLAVFRSWNDFGTEAFAFDDAAALSARVSEIASLQNERISSAAMRREAAQKAVDALVATEDPSQLPASWKIHIEPLDATTRALVESPTHSSTLSPLRERFIEWVRAQIDQREPLEERRARLQQSATLVTSAREVGFLDDSAASGLDAAIGARMGQFILVAVNPHAMPMNLRSPVLPPDSVVSPNTEATFTFQAAEEAPVLFNVSAGDAYAPMDISLTVAGGNAVRWTIPAPGRKPVELRLALPALPANTPQIVAAIEQSPGEWKPLSGAVMLPEGVYKVRFTRDDYEPTVREIALVSGEGVEVPAPAHAEWTPSEALRKLGAVASLSSISELKREIASDSGASLLFPAHIARWEAQKIRLREMQAAALPTEIAASFARLNDYFSWLVQLQEPVALTRYPFRRSVSFADAAVPLSIPVLPEGVSLPPDTLVQLECLRIFSPAWAGMTETIPRELAVALETKAAGWQAGQAEWAGLARDVAMALEASDPRKVPSAHPSGSSWLRAQWQAHASFNRDFPSANTALAHLAEFGDKGGTANRYDFILAAAAAVLVWENAVDSVKEGTAIGGTRHRAESEIAVNALRQVDKGLARISPAELAAGIDWILTRGADGPWAGRHLTVLAAMNRLRLPAASSAGVATILDRERAAFETRSHPDDIKVAKRRLSNLNYLLLDY